MNHEFKNEQNTYPSENLSNQELAKEKKHLKKHRNIRNSAYLGAKLVKIYDVESKGEIITLYRITSCLGVSKSPYSYVI